MYQCLLKLFIFCILVFHFALFSGFMYFSFSESLIRKVESSVHLKYFSLLPSLVVHIGF